MTKSVPLGELSPTIHHFRRPTGKQNTPGGRSSRLSSFIDFPRRTWALSAVEMKTLGFERVNWGPERNTPFSGRRGRVWAKNSLTLWLTHPSELPTRFLSHPFREVRTGIGDLTQLHYPPHLNSSATATHRVWRIPRNCCRACCDATRLPRSECAKGGHPHRCSCDRLGTAALKPNPHNLTSSEPAAQFLPHIAQSPCPARTRPSRPNRSAN